MIREFTPDWTPTTPFYYSVPNQFVEDPLPPIERRIDIWRKHFEYGRLDLRSGFINDCLGSKVLRESADPKVLVWLHDATRVRVGFAGATLVLDRRGQQVCVLQRLYVVPPARCMGAGSALMSCVLLLASCDRVQLGAGLRAEKAARAFFV